MNKCLGTVLACLMMLATGMNTLLADTQVFEDGFYFIVGPAEFDDVIVGEGAIVAFDGDVIITGDLKVIDGGFVSANDCLIEGDVKADRAAIVDLLRATVGGDVSIKRTGGDAVLGILPLISIQSCEIHGDVKVTNNNVNSITISNNLIGGKLQVKNNNPAPIGLGSNQTNLNHHCKHK